ncbi:MAG: UDP-N-acetylmuramoyl-tripeptide--D-alanyl-D-alanine ligase [Rhodobacteraceae bacterium]|nr:UDP-N-acetylmuramoyl-tripeptide--D-alanyl-D-alanine ligase [Paracoccaceae bacterium]MBR26365.1 UDP-N-acetylmuramoyl-tripeptide--D-alanyl-D-alanine ligase [Paracoccaceae bacterium]
MTTPLWTSEAAEAATGGRATRAFVATGVSIDSRAVAKGDLFVALKDVRDGHDFVVAALEAGAAAALVSRIPEGAPADAPLLIVEDPLKGLEALAAAARARTGARVIGVTGSVGKTSTKEMLRAALGAQGRVHAAEKSYNNHWGVPLTLARMPAETDYAVIEIGMNHAGEIRPLTRLARPHAAIVTTVAPVHLAHFRDEREIAFAKAEIFEGLEPGGAAILYRDNPHYERLARRARRFGARVLRFGEAPRCQARMTGLALGAAETTVSARLHGREALVKVGAPGRHFAVNALAVLLAVEAVGADPARAALALGTWTAPDGRGSRWRIVMGEVGLDGAVHLIDESYNANPTSVGAALDVLACAEGEDGVGRIGRSRRIAMLGDMLEMGPEAEALHAGLATHPALDRIDVVHCCGPLMKAMHAALPPAKRGVWVADSAKLADQIRRLVDAGDVVMVKGSLGARMARVVDGLKAMGRPAPERAAGDPDGDAD